jgi:hypothetical protein
MGWGLAGAATAIASLWLLVLVQSGESIVDMIAGSCQYSSTVTTEFRCNYVGIMSQWISERLSRVGVPDPSGAIGGTGCNAFPVRAESRSVYPHSALAVVTRQGCAPARPALKDSMREGREARTESFSSSSFRSYALYHWVKTVPSTCNDASRGYYPLTRIPGIL